ncbi:MAG: J domain-containing protein, partial [Alphaproteobacteria bacterium]|nr:J domain-containing protein [Alphaproteobacteria bacterium]
PEAARPAPEPADTAESGRGAGWRADAENMFADLLRPRGRRGAPRDGEDFTVRLRLSFEEAMLGGERRVTLPTGKTLTVRLPPGMSEDRPLRLKGHGAPGEHGGQAGDALIEVMVKPHSLYRREGRDIHMTVPVSVPEALLGGEIRVPTVHGPVDLTLPEGTKAGQVLRLKGKGVPADPRRGLPAGDGFVHVEIALPDRLSEAARAALRDWQARAPYDPRKGLG